ncbi:MAG: flagella basal body P-ring formation protein FlgA [Thermoproteota archaeon]|jgi:flagella basal body P-ring formation protein FlgA
MVKILTFFALILLYTVSANSCEIETYANIYKGSKVSKVLIKNSNCPTSIQDNFIEFIGNVEGVISARQFKNSFNHKIDLQPKIIKVTSLKSFIKRAVKLPFNYFVKGLRLLSTNQSIYNDKKIGHISCSTTCLDSGSKNILLRLNNQNIWVSANIKIKSKVYVLNRSIDIHSRAINPEHVVIKEIFINKNDSYITDIKTLQFFKPNKRIPKYTALRVTDLSPLNLVRAGMKVNVTINANNISLKSTGIARRNGQHRDEIEIYNPISKKKYIGTVTDFNKVVVNL